MSSTVTLHVKWGKELIILESFDPQVGVKGLKALLEEKTHVPIDRMKLMSKSKGLWKGVLKDDVDLMQFDWTKDKDVVNLLLMGSAAQLTKPKQATVFLEDLPPEEVAKVQEPSGLVNLGNTCYLNSVLQCLRAIPQLRQGLRSYQSRSNDTGKGVFLETLRMTYHSLDRQADPFQPAMLVQATKMAFPQFAQRGPSGQPMQQDAEEFYSALLAVIADETNGRDLIDKAFDTHLTDAELLGAENLVDAVFGLKLKETLSCDEFASAAGTGDKMDTDANHQEAKTQDAVEPPVITYDLHRKLVCNIQGGSDASAQTNVSHIAEGIQLSLSGKIHKHSDVLGRDAVWTRQQRIARLPPVLVVQFGRFYWKATPDSADHAGVKCKVMKPVAFHSTMDVYEFCTPEIQKTLKVARDKALKAEEDRINKKLKGELDAEKKENGDQPMETDDDNKSENAKSGDDQEDAELQAALAMSMETEQPPVGPGLPNDFQGVYELFAVVTHKGRDADGGHYMAWVKADQQGKAQKIADTDEDNEDWFVFDDDEVSPCKTEDVLKLKGGGDWHMSYLNFYRAKK